jgi:hypothetical protein
MDGSLPEEKFLRQIMLDINISLRKGKAAIWMEKHKKKTWPVGQVSEEEAVLFFGGLQCISFWFSFLTLWAATQKS